MDPYKIEWVLARPVQKMVDKRRKDLLFLLTLSSVKVRHSLAPVTVGIWVIVHQMKKVFI